MSGLVKYDAKKAKIVEALSVIRREGYAHAAAVPVERRKTRIDIPRICATHGKAYASRYLFVGSNWEYAGPVKVSTGLYQSQYANNPDHGVLNSNDLMDETCPHCGVEGHGAILCGSCHSEICHGLATASHFRCFCGNEGRLLTMNRNNGGLLL